MQRFILAAAMLSTPWVPAVGQAEPLSIYVEQLSCKGGLFGLSLPKRLPEVMKLGDIEREEVVQLEKWEGYTTSRKYVYFPGLTLGLVTFSNDPNRYMVSSAEVTSPRWQHVTPFRIGESIHSVRAKLGSPAASDPDLKASYGSESGDITFQHVSGKITKVSYACYTG